MRTLPKSLDGVDVEAGLRGVNGDSKLYLRVLESAYRQHRDVAQTIETALADNSFDEAQRLSHTIKGIAGTLGANELQSVSADLEAALRDQKMDRARALMDDFGSQVGRVMLAIAPIVQQAAAANAVEGAGPQACDNGQLKQALAKLSDLIAQGDAEAIDLMAQINQMPGSCILAEELKRLAAQIDDFEFEDARPILARILNTLSLEE